MVYLRNTANTYIFYDITGRRLFDEERYNALIDFTEKDTSSVLSAVKDYFYSKLDENCRIIESNDSDRKAKVLEKIMTGLHPYFKYDKSAVPSILCQFLNLCLIRKGIELSEKDYLKRAQHITDAFMPVMFNGTIGDRVSFFNGFLNQYREKQTGDVSLIFVDKVQQLVKRIIYWVLDVSVKRFEGLSLKQRCALYSSVFKAGLSVSDLKIKEHIYFSEPDYERIQSLTSYEDAFKLLDIVQSGNSEDVDKYIKAKNQKRKKLDEAGEFAKVLSALTDDEISLDKECNAYLSSQIKKTEKQAEQSLFRQYEICSFTQLMMFELMKMIEKGVILKRCRYCKRLFLADRPNIEYCSRKVEGTNQTCLVAGPQYFTRENRNSNICRKAYDRKYRTMYNHCRMGLITKEALDAWRNTTHIALKQVQTGLLPEKEFLKLINSKN